MIAVRPLIFSLVAISTAVVLLFVFAADPNELVHLRLQAAAFVGSFAFLLILFQCNAKGSLVYTLRFHAVRFGKQNVMLDTSYVEAGMVILSIFVFVGYLQYYIHFFIDNDEWPVKAYYGRLSGIFALLLLFFVPTLSLKYSVFHLVLGTSYTAAMQWHRILGALFLAICTVHGIAMCFYFSESEYGIVYLLQNDGMFPPLYGIIAASCFLVASIPAVPRLRRAYYAVFKVCHYSVFPGLVFIFFHCLNNEWMESFGDSLKLPLFCMLLDWTASYAAFSLAPLQYLKAQKHTIADGSLLHLKFKRDGFSDTNRAMFVSISMSSSLITHPFSCIRDHQGFCHVMIHSMQGSRWKSALCRNIECSVSAPICVHGPFLLSPFAPHSNVYHMFVCGGIGITALADRWNHAVASSAATRMVWAVRHEDMLHPVLPLLSDAKRINIHVSSSSDVEAMPVGMRLQHGRPSLQTLITGCHQDLSKHGMERIMVYVSGPPSMVSDCRSAVRALSNADLMVASFEL